MKPNSVNFHLCQPLRLPSGTAPSSLTRVQHVLISGERGAKGWAVTVDPAKARLRLFVDRRMLDYDFSRFKIVDPKVSDPPELRGQAFSPALGQTLREIVAAGAGRIVFACNGDNDNLWATNSVAVIDGAVIKRTAPGMRADRFYPLNGRFDFFVFDPDRVGLESVVFVDGNNQSPITFRNGLHGPVLLRQGQDVSGLIKNAVPNVQSSEVLWKPLEYQAAMTAVGRQSQGEITLVSVAGDPDLGNEPRLADLVGLLERLKIQDAILLGRSGDVQQYYRLSAGRENWLIAHPQSTSTMAKMFPAGRPLSSAILIETA